MKALRILKYVGFGILGLAFVVLTVYVTMLLWNSLIPVLFHGPVLTFWQTAGLFILSKILFTGLAPHQPGNNKKDWRRRYHGKFKPGWSREESTTAPENL
jgi:hypothetical protein